MNNTNSIRETVKRLHAEGYNVSENALRNWVKAGLISARYSGCKAYLYYPEVVRFLTNGEVAA